ncbi:hypothetical protein HY414_02425 [Candidatus Kaiserbacteria bacterium]|nr:hypothetical protein [Candidatus Kaiserbacteria bacterium]
MAKYIIGAIVIILIAISGYYAWQQYGQGAPAPSPTPAPEVQTMQTYATSTFSIQYPSDFSVDESYEYTQFEGKPIAGVSFTIPASMAEGTNLSSDTYLSVESLPRARNCTGDIYIPANVKAVELSMGTTTYSVATTSGAAAGNLYEEHVFALIGSKPCTAVRYYIHSGNIGNYPPEGEEGAVREFDRADLLRKFDAIRDSLILNQ